MPARLSGLHVAVLMGGLSPEREVSLTSGRACAEALDRLGANVTRVDAGRDLAQVLTGEVPNGLTCHFSLPEKVTAGSSLDSAVGAQLGSPALGTTVAPARGWTVASWLVAHAQQYGISQVRYAGYVWNAADGSMGWQRAGPALNPPRGSIVAG